MLTLHVFNSVKFSGGYWAGDIVSSLFSCYGGLMARDLLAGSRVEPCNGRVVTELYQG